MSAAKQKKNKKKNKKQKKKKQKNKKKKHLTLNMLGKIKQTKFWNILKKFLQIVSKRKPMI